MKQLRQFTQYESSSAEQDEEDVLEESEIRNDGIQYLMRDCTVCNNRDMFIPAIFSNRLIRAKYWDQFIFYYAKQINEILTNSPVHHVTIFKEYLFWDDENEYLKKSFPRSEIGSRLHSLTDFYASVFPRTRPVLYKHDVGAMMFRRAQKLDELHFLKQEHRQQQTNAQQKLAPALQAQQLQIHSQQQQQADFAVGRYPPSTNSNNLYPEQSESDINQLNMIMQNVATNNNSLGTALNMIDEFAGDELAGVEALEIREEDAESGAPIQGSFLKEYNNHESHISYDSSSHNIYYPRFSSGELPSCEQEGEEGSSNKQRQPRSKNKNFFDEVYQPNRLKELQDFSWDSGYSTHQKHLRSSQQSVAAGVQQKAYSRSESQRHQVISSSDTADVFKSNKNCAAEVAVSSTRRDASPALLIREELQWEEQPQSERNTATNNFAEIQRKYASENVRPNLQPSPASQQAHNYLKIQSQLLNQLKHTSTAIQSSPLQFLPTGGSSTARERQAAKNAAAALPNNNHVQSQRQKHNFLIQSNVGSGGNDSARDVHSEHHTREGRQAAAGTSDSHSSKTLNAVQALNGGTGGILLHTPNLLAQSIYNSSSNNLNHNNNNQYSSSNRGGATTSTICPEQSTSQQQLFTSTTQVAPSSQFFFVPGGGTQNAPVQQKPVPAPGKQKVKARESSGKKRHDSHSSKGRIRTREENNHNSIGNALANILQSKSSGSNAYREVVAATAVAPPQVVAAPQLQLSARRTQRGTAHSPEPLAAKTARLQPSNILSTSSLRSAQKKSGNTKHSQSPLSGGRLEHSPLDTRYQTQYYHLAGARAHTETATMSAKNSFKMAMQQQLLSSPHQSVLGSAGGKGHTSQQQQQLQQQLQLQQLSPSQNSASKHTNSGTKFNKKLFQKIQKNLSTLGFGRVSATTSQHNFSDSARMRLQSYQNISQLKQQQQPQQQQSQLSESKARNTSVLRQNKIRDASGEAHYSSLNAPSTVVYAPTQFLFTDEGGTKHARAPTTSLQTERTGSTQRPAQVITSLPTGSEDQALLTQVFANQQKKAKVVDENYIRNLIRTNKLNAQQQQQPVASTVLNNGAKQKIQSSSNSQPKRRPGEDLKSEELANNQFFYQPQNHANGSLTSRSQLKSSRETHDYIASTAHSSSQQQKNLTVQSSKNRDANATLLGSGKSPPTALLFAQPSLNQKSLKERERAVDAKGAAATVKAQHQQPINYQLHKQ